VINMMKNIKERPYKDEAWLRQKYEVELLSPSNIGKLCGVYTHTINLWLRRFNIPARKENIWDT